MAVGAVDDGNKNNGSFMKESGWKIAAFGVIVVIVGALGVSFWFASKAESVTARSRHTGSRYRSDSRF